MENVEKGGHRDKDIKELGEDKTMEITVYQHKAQYYETDQMGIVHHSNYIRWMEEARSDLLEQAGAGYGEMEAMGIISPVISVSCSYKSMTRFGDTVVIDTRVTSYNGICMTAEYEIRDKETGKIRCTGTSEHCFLDRNQTILTLKKFCPQLHQLLNKLLEYGKSKGNQETKSKSRP